ncbi:MAG: hypothetical protein RML73_04075 [Anaerolineae bacterium]|nr:hypothetical protein [Anaerolineae bacterium]
MLRLVLALIFMALLAPSLAQTDPSAGDVDLFGGLTSAAYIFVQMAENGTLAEDAQGLLNVRLQGIDQHISVIQVNPPNSLLYNIDSLSKDWANALTAHPDLVVAAELRIDSSVLYLALRTVSYEQASRVLLLSAELLDYLPALEGAAADPQALSEKYAIPASFEQAQLVIIGSEALWLALQQSALERLQNLRSDVADCIKAQQRIAQLNALVRSNAASAEEVRAANRELRFWINWRSANCR